MEVVFVTVHTVQEGKAIKTVEKQALLDSDYIQNTAGKMTAWAAARKATIR